MQLLKKNEVALYVLIRNCLQDILLHEKWKVQNNVLSVSSLTIFMKQTGAYVYFICIDYFQNHTPISKTYFQLYDLLNNLLFLTNGIYFSLKYVITFKMYSL